MKQGIIYGGAFLFVFVIVTGLLIYLNSSYENIFKFNFTPKSLVQLTDSTSSSTVDTTLVINKEPLVSEPDTSNEKDSVLLSSLAKVETKDTAQTEKAPEKVIKDTNKDIDLVKQEENTEKKIPDSNLGSIQPVNFQAKNQNTGQGKEYTDWVKKVTSIYSAMEPKKAAKIIQTYSDNVARDILYNMNKKTAAKVVSEFSPETANRIFRFE